MGVYALLVLFLSVSHAESQPSHQYSIQIFWILSEYPLGVQRPMSITNKRHQIDFVYLNSLSVCFPSALQVYPNPSYYVQMVSTILLNSLELN